MVGVETMIYLWEDPENYLNRDVGEYDKTCSPDRFLLRTGHALETKEFSPIPILHFEVSKKRVLKFDCLPNNTSIPLVNEKVKHILETMASNEVQFFPAKLICADGELEGYYFLNATRTFKGIDHERSTYTKIAGLDAICGFKTLIYKSGCLKEYHLARDEEYKGHLLVNEQIKAAFDKEKITGVRFVRPEEYYRGPLTAQDLLEEERRLTVEKYLKED